MIDEPDIALQQRWRRVGAGVLLAACIAVIVGGIVGWIAYQRFESYGTVWADKTPPRIDRCGRRWYKNEGQHSSGDLPPGLVRVSATAGGAAILSSHTGCPDTTTVTWARVRDDQFVSYSLSGGP